jgi:hypothetical protein
MRVSGSTVVWNYEQLSAYRSEHAEWDLKNPPTHTTNSRNKPTQTDSRVVALLHLSLHNTGSG